MERRAPIVHLKVDVTASFNQLFRDGLIPLNDRVVERLHAAALHGHVAVSKQLLAARCNVDLQTSKGFTALQFAEDRGTPESPR